ncbi:unnamed protein product [Paramecium primaurelia]|uniref:Uncharacterized protein n=1 Tax=Paramecium primaurelia TaxID=5886 RepID=A0A8S1MPL2_PARPR|nr:unnamed protein product [Paramecium primaurelia]
MKIYSFINNFILINLLLIDRQFYQIIQRIYQMQSYHIFHKARNLLKKQQIYSQKHYLQSNYGLNQLYGQGKNRRLWFGEEALLMETIRLYIDKVLQNPRLMMHGVAFNLLQIITISELIEITNYKLCMLQLECHRKMMITRSRYSGNKEFNKKN